MLLLRSAKFKSFKVAFPCFVRKYITQVFATPGNYYFIKLDLKILMCFNFHLPAVIYYVVYVFKN